MTLAEIDALIAGLAPAIKLYVEAEIARLAERIAKIEVALATLESNR
jgi:hypothetical protein